MLKHEEIISKMTTQEKLSILHNFSNINKENLPDEFNNLSQKISLRGLHFNGSVLPNIGNISSSFNDDLMYKYSSFLGYTAYKNGYKLLASPSINVFNKKNLISKEPYLNGIVLDSFIKGLSDNSIIPLINYFDNDNAIRNDDFIHVNEYLQCILNLKDNDKPFLFFDNKSNKYKTNRINEIIPKLGYEHILVNNISYEGQPKNTISFNKGAGNTPELTEDEINGYLDELIDLLSTDHHSENNFDYAKLLNELVIESTCLLKNNDVLPLNKHYDVAFFTNSNITDIDFIGLKDDLTVKVYDRLPSFSDKDKYNLLILVVDNSEDIEHLNKELHKIHNAHDRNIKICVVLTTNDVINTNFDKYIDCLIKTVNLDKTNVKTFMDILLGKKCPCGKLNISYPKDDYEFLGNELLTEEHTKYPFGYSLNYGKLTYSDFKYDRNKLTFLVKNEDKTCVSDVIQIYMENQRWLGEKHLIYYKKVYLQPQQSQRVSIVLTRDMFMRFNMNSGTYRLKKGLYRIYVNNSLTNCLKDYLVIFDISKDTLVGKKFKNSALVALEPRYKGKVSNPKYKKYILLGLLIASSISSLSYIFTRNIISFIVGLVLMLMAIVVSTYKPKPKVSKKFDLDKYYTSDDVIQFEEFYKKVGNSNEYVYDKSEIFKEERNVESKESKKENLFYVNGLDDVKKVFKDLYSYFISKGLTIDYKQYFDLCGAICSSRVIYINTNNASLIQESCALANKFLNDLVFDCSNLKETLKIAKANPNKIIFSFINTMNENIKLINNDCKFNTMKFSLNLDNNEYELSKNIWYFIPYQKMEIKYFDFNAVVCDVSYQKVKEVPYEREFYQVYYPNVREYINSLSDIYTFDENLYKKFDELTNKMNNLANNKYLNKLVCHVETFIALNLLFNNDINTTIDNLFSFKLIYYIVRHNFVHLNGTLTKDFIINNLVDIFGEDALKHTLEVIKEIDFEELRKCLLS